VFDPYDPADHEYWGYVGYLDGQKQRAGLPPLSSITITVPLAFWDSGRINFSTDGEDQFKTYGGDGKRADWLSGSAGVRTGTVVRGEKPRRVTKRLAPEAVGGRWPG
jgi:hypothetical protein